jgi:hypothetical protein
MSSFQKIHFYLHKSLFVQLGLLFLFLVAALCLIHFKCKNYAENNLEKLKHAAIEEKSFIVGDYNKLSTDLGNNLNKPARKISDEEIKKNHFYSKGERKEDLILKIESNKFGDFFNTLEKSFYPYQKI